MRMSPFANPQVPPRSVPTATDLIVAVSTEGLQELGLHRSVCEYDSGMPSNYATAPAFAYARSGTHAYTTARACANSAAGTSAIRWRL